MKDLLILYRYIWHYRGRTMAAILFGVLAAALNFASLGGLLLIFKNLFDKPDPANWARVADWLPVWLGPLRPPLDAFFRTFVPDHRWETLCIVAGVLFVLVLVKAGARYIQEYCSGYVAVQATRLLSLDLHRAVIDQPVGFFTDARVGQTISRLTNDVSVVSQGLEVLFGRVVREPLNFLVYLVFCLVIDWRLTLINMIVLPPLAWAIYTLGSRAKLASRKAMVSSASIMGILAESLTGIRIVKAFVGEPYERSRFDRENRQLTHQRMKVVRADASVHPLVEVLTYTGGLAALLVAGRFIISGSMQVSASIAFYLSLIAMSDPLRKLASVNNRLQQMLAGTRRIVEYRDLVGEGADTTASIDLPPFNREIRYENVSFSYDGERPALSGVSFVAARGQVVALVGHSGAGKSSIVSLLPRFYRPTAGRITIDGVDIGTVSLRSLRARIGLVTQETVLFDDTVEHNIAYGADLIDPERVLAAARAAHAHEFIRELPSEYRTVIGEGGGKLSGGQRQRLAIARALYKDPEILILDEATSSVDSESELLIRDALARLMKGRTVFVIAHRLATVERADKIVVVNAGRIEAMGTHTELLRSCPSYGDLYRNQFASDSSSVQSPSGPASGIRTV